MKPFIDSNLSTSSHTQHYCCCYQGMSSEESLVSCVMRLCLIFKFRASTTSSVVLGAESFGYDFLLCLLTSFITIGVFKFPYFSRACSFRLCFCCHRYRQKCEDALYEQEEKSVSICAREEVQYRQRVRRGSAHGYGIQNCCSDHAKQDAATDYRLIVRLLFYGNGRAIGKRDDPA